MTIHVSILIKTSKHLRFFFFFMLVLDMTSGALHLALEFTQYLLFINLCLMAYTICFF